MLLSYATLERRRNKQPVASSVTRTEEHGHSLEEIDRLEQRLEVGSAVSSENSMNTEASGISQFSTYRNSGVAQSSMLMGRLEEAILDSVREGGHTRDTFELGLGDSIRREKRNEWLSVENELHRVQALASRSVQTSTTSSQLRLLGQLREAITDAMHFLLEGSHLDVDHNNVESNPLKLGSDSSPKNRGRKNGSSMSHQNVQSQKPQYFVWSSPQLARSAIIQEAISASLRQANMLHMMNGRPLVVLVIERCLNLEIGEGREQSKDPQELSEQESFLSAWTRATVGIADAITVAVENSNQMRNSIHKVLKGASEESSVVPALVCLHASGDSTIPSDISSLRTICDSFGARLCIEGSALALVAQPNRPSDTEECVREAHVLLLDPGAWFGFKMCAVVTKHEPNNARRAKLQQQKTSSSIDVLASCDNDDKHGLATGSFLNLWTVLSRIGLVSIRNRVEDVTALAESFLHWLESSPNVQTIYNGVGCVVRMSYALSREDRLMSVERAAENVSKANKAVISSLENVSKALMMHSVTAENNTFLQFSPSRFLRSGTFWYPSEDVVAEYIAQLQETINKYEPCKAGRVEFEGRAAKCRDIDLIVNEEDTPGLSLCFGAFRVVPHELSTSWGETSSSLDVVRSLTNLLVGELNESLPDIISMSFVLQQEMERSGLASRQKRSEKQRLGRKNVISQPQETPENYSDGDTDSEDDLPFVIYLNTNLGNGATDFISIEPKEACSPVQAVRQARLAAELIISVVDVISCRWRGSNLFSVIPRDLANVAGKEDFIPQTASREVLGCVDRREDSIQPEASRTGEAYIRQAPNESEGVGTRHGGHIFVDTESDEDSFHSMLAYSDEDELQGETTSTGSEQEYEEERAHRQTQGTLLHPSSQRARTADLKENAAESNGKGGRFESAAASGGEVETSGDHPASNDEDTQSEVQPGNPSPTDGSAGQSQTPLSPNSVQPRTRSHWLGIWSWGETRSSLSRKDEQGDEEDCYDEGYDSEDYYTDEHGAGDADGSSVPSSGSDESEEDGPERDDEESEEETDESDSDASESDDRGEEGEEESSDETELATDLQSDGSDDERDKSAAPKASFLGWFGRRTVSAPAARTVHANGSGRENSSDEGTESSSDSQAGDARNVAASEASATESRSCSRRVQWESEDSMYDEEEEKQEEEEEEEEEEEPVAVVSTKPLGKGSGMLADPAGGPSAFGIAWLRRRWTGGQDKPKAKGASSGESEESVHDDGSMRAVVDVEETEGYTEEEDEDVYSDDEDAYSDDEGEDMYSENEDENEDAYSDDESEGYSATDDGSATSVSGSYDSHVGDSESETETENDAPPRCGIGGPDKEEQKSRVVRYFGWLAPSWTGAADKSPQTRKGTLSRAGGRSYDEGESSSESESDVLEWRGRAVGRSRPVTRRRS